MTLLDPARIGQERGDAAALAACAEVVVAFCELLDAGDAAAAFSLHSEDLEFHPPGAVEPVGREGALAMGERILYSYAGRRVLHLVSNFLGRAMSDDRVEAQYVVTVYELTRNVDGVAEERETPALFAFAQERATFARADDGRWQYIEQRMIPLAPRKPFGEKTA